MERTSLLKYLYWEKKNIYIYILNFNKYLFEQFISTKCLLKIYLFTKNINLI